MSPRNADLLPTGEDELDPQQDGENPQQKTADELQEPGDRLLANVVCRERVEHAQGPEQADGNDRDVGFLFSLQTQFGLQPRLTWQSGLWRDPVHPMCPRSGLLTPDKPYWYVLAGEVLEYGTLYQSPSV